MPGYAPLVLTQLSNLDSRTWLRALPLSIIAAVAVAIPTDLIDTRLFFRPVLPRPVDYVILAITAVLIGLIFAIKPALTDESVRQEARTIGGGFVSVLAVGCPVCNHVVVALVGTSGALSWWAPVQPLVGVVAIGLLLYTLRVRLRTYDLAACPI